MIATSNEPIPFTRLYIPTEEERRLLDKLEIRIGKQPEVLGKILDAYQIIAVIGAQWGDEAKGKVLHALASDPRVGIGIRPNGAQNAGHTINYDNMEFIAHIIPSTIMEKKVISAIGRNCAVDIQTMIEQELMKLAELGIDYKDRLFIGNVGLVLPHHKILDFLLSPPNSSTYSGVSYAYKAKAGRQDLCLLDILNKNVDNHRLRGDLNTYNALLKYKGIEAGDVSSRLQEIARDTKRKLPQHVLEFAKATSDEERIIVLEDILQKAVSHELFPQIADTSKKVQEVLSRETGRNRALVEATQSTFLSNEIKDELGYGTSAQTHGSGVLASLGVDITRYKSTTISVIKVPSSRVGKGPHPGGYVHQMWFVENGFHNKNDVIGHFPNYSDIQHKFYEAALAQPYNDHRHLDCYVTSEKDGKSYRINEAMGLAHAEKNKDFGSSTEKPRNGGVPDGVKGHIACQIQGPLFSMSAADRYNGEDFFPLTYGYRVNLEGNDDNGKSKPTEIRDEERVYHNGDIILAGERPTGKVLEYCQPLIELHQNGSDDPITPIFADTHTTLPKNLAIVINRYEKLTGATIMSIGTGPDTNNMLWLERD